MPLSPQRDSRLTASNFGAAIGGLAYKSRAALFRETTGRVAPFEGNDATRWGVHHEPLAIAEYERITGAEVDLSRDRQTFLIHPTHDWLGCTPDGFTGARLVEIKCPYSQKNIADADIRSRYMPQLQGQMEISNIDEVDLVCWTPHKTTIWRIAQSRDYWSWMFTHLEEFWRFVQTDTEPPRLKRRREFGGVLAIERTDGT